MIKELYTHNHNSYYEDDYVKLTFDNGEEILTKFTEEEFKEYFNPILIVQLGKRKFIPLINCSCGSFDCGGDYTELIEEEDSYHLKDLYSSYSIRNNEPEEGYPFSVSIKKEDLNNMLS